MATNDKKTNDMLDDIKKVTYGTSSDLDHDIDLLKGISRKITQNADAKFNTQAANNDLIGYVNNIGFDSLFNTMSTEKGKVNVEKKQDISMDFTQKMTEIGQTALSGIEGVNAEDSVKYENYRLMRKLIPECSLALDVYTSNITSPDDFNKRIFNINYKNDEAEQYLSPIVKQVIDKYEIEDKTEEIIKDTLANGIKYVAVLQYTDEFNKMLGSKSTVTKLNEDATLFNVLDTDYIKNDNTVTDILDRKLTSDEISMFEAYFGVDLKVDSKKNLNESVINEAKSDVIESNIANIINENIKIGTKADILRERFDLETIFGNEKEEHSERQHDVPTHKLGRKTNKEKDDTKLYVNGSAIRYLETENVIEIKCDDIVYGYYYIEYRKDLDNPKFQSWTNQNTVAYNTSVTSSPVVSVDVRSDSDTSTPEAKIMNVTDQMYDFIAKVFLKGLSKKLNKKFITENKQFSNLIYSLVRQKYIKDKQIRITFFRPEEVIKFETQSIFENATYVAKLYLATLTNDIIIKLGRGHDKRVFYVNTGGAKDFEQAIMKTVQDIKSKDIGYSSLGSINSALSLSSGRFDDYYIPQLPDGTRAVSIDAIAGMNSNEDTELLEYFRKALINCMDLPAAAISDLQENVEYARQVSAQNAQFLRHIITHQLHFNKDFTMFIRRLVDNEIKFAKDGELNELKFTSKDFECSFQSPGALQMTNMLEQTNNVNAIVDFIVNSQITDSQMDPNAEPRRNMYRKKLVKHFLSQWDWDTLDDLLTEADAELSKHKIEQGANGQDDGQGQYM